MVSGAADEGACAASRADHGAHAPSAISALRRIPRIDSLEVFQNGASLVGGEAAELVPRRLTELHGRLAAGVGVVGLELVATLCRRRLTLAGVLAVLFLERAAGVQQPPEELLLPRDGRRVEPPALQRLRQLLRFLRQLRRAIAPHGLPHL